MDNVSEKMPTTKVKPKSLSELDGPIVNKLLKLHGPEDFPPNEGIEIPRNGTFLKVSEFKVDFVEAEGHPNKLVRSLVLKDVNVFYSHGESDDKSFYTVEGEVFIPELVKKFRERNKLSAVLVCNKGSYRLDDDLIYPVGQILPIPSAFNGVDGITLESHLSFTAQTPVFHIPEQYIAGDHSPDRQEQLTPKELYEKANELVKSGRKLDAVPLFEKARYVYQALKICEEEGDIQRAYQIAMNGNDHYSADRLATRYHIAGHEYFNFPPASGRDFIEVMAEALESRLRTGATAEKLGFHGFKDKIVADVGTRDGRFIPLFRKLGAKDVYGIDPNNEDLQKAIQAGLLDRDHAIPKLLQDIPEQLKGKVEVAAIFNFNIPISERAEFFSSLSDALVPNGEIVMTIAEREIAKAIKPIVSQHFNLRSTRLWDGKENLPHAYLVIGTKK